MKPKPNRQDLYYVFAYVPDDAPNQFFVMTQAEVNMGVKQRLDRVRKLRTAKGLSTEKVGVFPVLPWLIVERHENKWKKLPG